MVVQTAHFSRLIGREEMDEHVILYHLHKGREMLAKYSNRKLKEGAPPSEVAEIEKGIKALSQEIKERRG